jgi:hypothetical protein
MKSTAVVPFIKDLGSISLVYCYRQYRAKASNWMDVNTLNAYQMNRKFRGKKKGLVFLN